MPWTGTLMVCAPAAGILADRFGERRFLLGGLLVQAAGSAWLAVTADPGSAYAELLPPLVAGGCGISMAMPAAQRAVVGIALGVAAALALTGALAAACLPGRVRPWRSWPGR